MRTLFTILSTLTSLYMLVIFIRILLTWFRGVSYGGVENFLANVTDPYLNWFRRFPLQVGFIDLSPILALAVLSIVNQVFQILANYGRISVGIILAMLLQAVWSAVSFLIGFAVVILALRLIAYLVNANIYGTFWRVIESIAQPILYRMNRLIFGKRLVNFRTGLIVSIAALIVGGLLLRLGVGLLSGLLFRLPL